MTALLRKQMVHESEHKGGPPDGGPHLYMRGLEREMGIEPTTLCLGSRCSTPELLPPGVRPSLGGPIGAVEVGGAAARPRCSPYAGGDVPTNHDDLGRVAATIGLVAATDSRSGSLRRATTRENSTSRPARALVTGHGAAVQLVVPVGAGSAPTRTPRRAPAVESVSVLTMPPPPGPLPAVVAV